MSDTDACSSKNDLLESTHVFNLVDCNLVITLRDRSVSQKFVYSYQLIHLISCRGRLSAGCVRYDSDDIGVLRIVQSEIPLGAVEVPLTPALAIGTGLVVAVCGAPLTRSCFCKGIGDNRKQYGKILYHSLIRGFVETFSRLMLNLLSFSCHRLSAISSRIHP